MQIIVAIEGAVVVQPCPHITRAPTREITTTWHSRQDKQLDRRYILIDTSLKSVCRLFYPFVSYLFIGIIVVVIFEILTDSVSCFNNYTLLWPMMEVRRDMGGSRHFDSLRHKLQRSCMQLWNGWMKIQGKCR